LDNTVDGHPLSHLKDFVETVKTKVPFLNINTMQLPGQLAANNFDDESLDLVLIDGDHSTEAVCRDIDVWLPKVKNGGILCGDDIGWKTVEDAVIEKFGNNFSKGQSVWWVYK
jgi:predicted O-methyltransferase YrrM